MYSIILVFTVKRPSCNGKKIVEKEGSSLGGFKTANSITHDILFENSKLLSYSHADQKSGKADQWRAYLRKNNAKKLYYIVFAS